MLLAPALTQFAAAKQMASVSASVSAQRARSPSQLKSRRPVDVPDGFLASASLRGPLQTAMLPFLPLPVLAKLRASCSSMKHLVDSLTAGTWAAAAEGYLPPCLIPTSGGDADRCLSVLQVKTHSPSSGASDRVVQFQQVGS